MFVEICVRIFQVCWSPLSHGMFLSAQAGKAVHLAHYAGVACSYEAVSDAHTGQVINQQIPRPLPRPPAWMRRRSVARFGWGGRLATARPPLGRDGVRAVTMRTLTLEPALKQHSEEFEQALGGDLRSYCLQKADEEDEKEAEYWKFIEVSWVASLLFEFLVLNV
jgi:hypothetical protein